VSAGVPVGALEVPGGDHIIVLHRGRGVTAGYPVPAVVTRHGLDRLAQLRPGECVHFTRGSVSTSVARYRSARRETERLRSRARTVLGRQFEISASAADETHWFAAQTAAVKGMTHDPSDAT
jgi:allophanate hydrolase subunit 2